MLAGVWAGRVVRRQSDHILSTHRKQKEQEQKVGPSYKASKPSPNDVLPPTRLHLLKVPSLPQTAPPSVDQLFKHIVHGRSENVLPVVPTLLQLHLFMSTCGRRVGSTGYSHSLLLSGRSLTTRWRDTLDDAWEWKQGQERRVKEACAAEHCSYPVVFWHWFSLRTMSM